MYDFKSKAVHSAADALRQILEKLPIDNLLPADDATDYNVEHGNTLDNGPAQLSDSHKPFQPYDIPSDRPFYSVPPPPFRPLPQSSGHSASGSAGPVNSITHTQIITTAYGAPVTGNIASGSAHSKQPVTLLDIETDHWQNVPIGPGVSQPGADGLYHVMSLKNHGINAHSGVVAAVPDQSLSAPYSQPEQQSQHQTAGHEHSVVVSQEVVHEEHQHQQHEQQHYQHEQHQQQQSHVQNFNIQQQLLPHYGPPLPTTQQLPHVFGPNAVGPIGYEIHKSIAYELRGPNFVQTAGPVQLGQRRTIKTKRHQQGPIGSRPPYKQQRRRRQ